MTNPSAIPIFSRLHEPAANVGSSFDYLPHEPSEVSDSQHQEANLVPQSMVPPAQVERSSRNDGIGNHDPYLYGTGNVEEDKHCSDKNKIQQFQCQNGQKFSIKARQVLE